MDNKHKINKIVRGVQGLTSIVILATMNMTSAYAEDVKVDTDNRENIVGGTESSAYSRPYQVALLMNGQQGCGGTLIGSQWVLTAAHCLDNASTASLTVKVGAHRMGGNDGQTHRVSQIIKHENWRGAQSIQSGYDIGVLHLASPVSSSIKPAYLPSQSTAEQIAAVGSYITVSGWGTTYYRGRPSDVLREVDLPVITNSSCSSQLGVSLGNGVVCGGGPNGTSACNGDSGGPFAVKSGGDFYSIGTVSWGKNCSGATAFTRTSAYLAWIKAKTGITPPAGDKPPVARFTASTSDLTVTLSNASTDDKGVASSSWDFGDGNTSNQSNPSHTYAQEGSYTISLRVTDTSGQADSTAQSIMVGSDCAPGMSSEVYPTWSVSVSYALGDRVTYDGVNYEATWWSTGAKPTIYANVWKSLGDDPQCPIENEAPVANFSTTVNGLTVSFIDASTDDKAIVSHSWSFGDGATSSQTSPSYTYNTRGDYSVSLTVKDGEGKSHTISRDVSVSPGDSGCDGVEQWAASVSYAVGDLVSYNNYKYEAIWWSTGAKPDVFSNVWAKKGACAN